MDNTVEKTPINLIFLYGKGGAGKDTAGERLALENPGWSIISTGDRIKQARNPNDEFHHVIAPYEYLIDEGKNLPTEVVINPENPGASIFPAFIESELKKGTDVIISTGFPRTLEQLAVLDSYLAKISETHDILQSHLYLNVSDDTVRNRIRKRREIYANEGRTVRSDDADLVIERRITTFRNDTLPLVQTLLNEGRAISINAEGTIDEVHVLVGEALGARNALGIKNLDEAAPSKRERL